MDDKTAIKSTGMKVLASDAYWGSYTGVLQGIFSTPKERRARVLIAECVEYPSQYAIIFKNNKVNRPPDEKGSIRNFDLCNVQLHEWNEEGGIILEDLLKEIVSQALEVRLGQAVEINHSEWEAAKRETLNDVYANKVCFFGNVTSDYFINTMVGILVVMKRTADAA